MPRDPRRLTVPLAWRSVDADTSRMALSLKVWLDRTSVRPDVDGPAHLVIEIEASGEPAEGPRPPATTVLAIDVSGSMQGTPIEQVIGEAYELLVDEAMAMERNPDEEAYKVFRKSAMVSKLAMHAPPAASSRGVASSKLLEHTAGKYPEAFIVVLTGQDAASATA